MNESKCMVEDNSIMKIAVITNDLCVRGGTHKQVLRLCQYLEKEGMDFKLYTKYYNPMETYPEFEKFDIVYLKETATKLDSSDSLFNKVKNATVKRREDRELMEMIPLDVDIYNFHDNGMLWMMKWAKSKRHAKVVWQTNDLPMCFRVWLSDTYKKSIKNKISRLIYKSIIKNIDKITVNVTKNKDRVVQLMNKDADVLYCGVDVNDDLKKHFFPMNKIKYNILTAGVFFPRRNYETLVRVIEQLKRESVPVHLDIIGSTEENPEYVKSIKELIDNSGLGNEITIWGQVDEDRYNSLFNEADIFSFVNINQSWGLAVFEAMSCGLPTLVSNSVGAIELLKGGEDSIIVDPLDVNTICGIIKRLISNEQYYNRISENASTVVKEYAWDKLYSSKLVGVFEQLMGEVTR